MSVNEIIKELEQSGALAENDTIRRKLIEAVLAADDETVARVQEVLDA